MEDAPALAVLGVDTASHRLRSIERLSWYIGSPTSANVPGLENVANLDQAPRYGSSWVIALPMKIAGRVRWAGSDRGPGAFL